VESLGKKLLCILVSKKLIFSVIGLGLLLISSVQENYSQKKFSRVYPASKNISLLLTNRTGTVTVEGWEKNEVRISASLEAPAANIIPQNLSGTIVINVVKDNQGRGEVGNVNFTIKVPSSSSVNIETRMGNLTVRDVSGGLVRAHITSEGDITLTNIDARTVAAENVIGDIFFDGVLKSGGNYRFASTRGNIAVRIPSNSSFRMVATAPSSRNISLGAFSGSGFNFVSDGRRVVGQAAGGSATLNVVNQRGSISFIAR
jgi:Putative adhesin